MPKKFPNHRPLTRPAARTATTHPYRQLLQRQAYKRFRTWLLRERPMCERCEVEPAEDIHHIRKLAEHPEDLCVEAWCECLCHSCHSQATARGE